ncbi:flagellar filament capping protein FliD [Paenibacillus terrigena]|uniref:flagellar filament capping protein FliD n=1 Tax=Paenibacillus terrigena TaxID=369333 RepID=UPI0028D0F4C0|nr:flagellar filament capping protein FliD [Paenibacillus terrigena]
MPIRISGMGSGLDIDKLVTDLMKAERIPLDKLKQKKTSVGWQSDLYREVNTKLTSLRNALNKIKLQGDWKDYKATSSNENAVSATVGAGVPPGNHTVEVTQLAVGATITGNKLADTFDPNTVVGSAGSITITINGKDETINYDATDTYKTIMNKVSSSPAGVRMSFDELTKQVSIVTKDTGKQVELSAADAGGILSALKLNNAGTKAYGKDAIFKIDGVGDGVNNLTSSKNTFTANGITYTFKEEKTGAATIRITGDNDGMVKQITEFVDAYNSTVELLNQRTKEKKNRGFDPLTDDQKSDMKEADIKNWEDKAKSGLLGNDQMLKSALSDLRSIVNNTVGSLPVGMNALFKIGISTVPYNSSSPNDAGKLVIDEEQLRKAITEDAGSVVGLFTDQTSGIASKMHERVEKSIKELIEKAGGVGSPTDSITNTLGLKLSDINKQITTFNDRLARKEDYYYKMFAAMDTAVSKNNSQLNWLLKNGS